MLQQQVATVKEYNNDIVKEYNLMHLKFVQTHTVARELETEVERLRIDLQRANTQAAHAQAQTVRAERESETLVSPLSCTGKPGNSCLLFNNPE